MPFVRKEDIEAVKTSGLFDEKWYLRQYPDVSLLGMDPVEHFLWLGGRLGRRPFPDFCSRTYLEIHSDVARAGIDPFLHFVRYGKRERRKLKKDKPSAKVVSAASTPPSENKFTKTYELIKNSGLFDREYYLKTYGRDVGEEDPISHYIRIGSDLGFDPSLNFSTSLYLEVYRDVRAGGVNPLAHYVGHGYREGRSPRPDPRQKKLGLPRLTPEETGNPRTILQFDRVSSPLSAIQREHIAVHVHLFHVEMAEDIADYLTNLRYPFTLLVSIPEGGDTSYWERYFEAKLSGMSKVVARAFPNRGRDVAPWVVGFAKEISRSTIFCHIHTKKSTHNRAHGGWFRYLCHTTFGSIGVVDGILHILSTEARTSIVAPCYFWTLASQPNYGKNRDVVADLYRKMGGGELPTTCPDYPAGSFFWARTSVLAPLFDLGLKFEDFADEAGQRDGTIAHGIERAIGLLPVLTGTDTHMVTVDVAYDLTRYISSDRQQIASNIRAPQKVRSALKSRVALYSCVSGGYEEVTPLATHVEGIDMFIFSDDAAIDIPKHHLKRSTNYISNIPVRTARFVKTHPHIWFNDYDFAVWCDSNIHFFGDISYYIDLLNEADADCGFILHPVRDTFRDEADVLIQNRVITDRPLVERQVARYSTDPSVIKSPLLETNFFICRPRSEKVARFMGSWWSEINRFTHRDQLSVNYALVNSGIKWINILPPGRSARDHEDFMLFAHSVNNRMKFIEMMRS